MCRSILATSTGDECLVLWKPPTPLFCEGELACHASCGCAVSVLIRFLDLTVQDSPQLAMMTRKSTRRCALHAGRLGLEQAPLIHSSSPSIAVERSARIISRSSADSAPTGYRSSGG